MPGVDKQSLSRQLNADPRVQQYIAQRYPNGTRGAAGVPADVIRSWGYPIPDGYGVAIQGKGAQVYDTHDKWDTILPAAGGALLGAGALGAAGVGPLAGGSGAAGSAAAGYGGAVAGTAVPASVIGTGLPAAATGANGITGTIASLFKNPQTYAALGPLIGQLASGGGFGGGGSGTSAEDDAFLRKAYEDAQYSQGLKEARFRRVDPLHESLTQLAFNRMPDNAREGISLNRVPLPDKRR